MRDIPLFKVFMSEDVLKPVADVLMSGYVGQGKKVDEFEEALGTYLGSYQPFKYLNPKPLTTNSGTAALHLALHQIKMDAEGRDEVLTTPLTCTATNFPIVANGLKIRWVDLDPDTCNVDLADLRRKITPKTAAIMVVHWGGYPVDLDELEDISRSTFGMYGYRIPVIEDCAHAFGAEFRGIPLGNHGNYCMFSFQAIKHLTTCDGGALIVPKYNQRIYQSIKKLRWYGLDRESSADFRCEQNIEQWGYKSNMNDLAAVIGLHNLPHLPGVLARHRENAHWLHMNLDGVRGVSLLERRIGHNSSDWVFTIRVERRAAFIKMMKAAGIGVSQVHDRNDKHQCLKEFKTMLPVTDMVCADMVCIPCGWWVTDEDREYIVETIRKGW